MIMRILGIDPGLATVGYGCIDWKNNKKSLVDYGVIETCKTLNFEDRITEIAQDIESLLSQFQPDQVVIEELYFSTNVKTAIAVAQARGVIVYTVNKNNYPIEHRNPLQVKQSMTGDGRADKKQVQKMVQYELNIDHVPSPDDAADALALALSCATASFKTLSVSL